jgi:hypothetical protein
MPKRIFRIREGEPLLDIVSYGRGGPRETGIDVSAARADPADRPTDAGSGGEGVASGQQRLPGRGQTHGFIE